MFSSGAMLPGASGTAAMQRVLTVLGSYMAVVLRAGLCPGLGVADEGLAITLRANGDCAAGFDGDKHVVAVLT